jgi:repressor LexA
MKELTERQKEVFEFIKEYISSHRYPPTLREVANHFSISVKGSFDHVRALKKKAFIRCDLKRSRAIEIIKDRESKEAKVELIPLIGKVAAGKPILAEENFEGSIEIPSGMLHGGQHFALHVKGDSMKNAGILDGDIAVIHQMDVANHGDIVVALLDDSATLKRLCIEKNRFKLKAENDAYPAIYSRDIKILGKLIFILRSYE